MKKIVRIVLVLGIMALCLFAASAALAEIRTGSSGTISWSLDTESGVLTFSGTGAMPDAVKTHHHKSGGKYDDPEDWDTYHNPWSGLSKSTKSIVIGEGITRVGDHNFYSDYFDYENYTWPNLTSVTFPSTLKSIGDFAFEDADKLTEINFAEGLETIGKYAFFDSGLNMHTLTLPKSLKIIGMGAFQWTKIKWAIIYDKVTSIGDNAFDSTVVIYGNPGTEAIEWAIRKGYEFCVLDTIHNLGGTINGQRVSIAVDENEVMGVNGFENIPADLASNYLDNTIYPYVKTLRIGKGTKSIGARAFENLTNLETVYLPASITSIGEDAFAGCTKLKSVTLMSEETVSIDDDAFPAQAITFHGKINTDVETYALAKGYSFKDPDVLGHGTWGGNITWVAYMNGTLDLTGEGKIQDADYSDGGEYDIGESDIPWFEYYSNIHKVVIHEGITDIGYAAFADCHVGSVSMPSSLRTIGAKAFAYCALSSVNIPDGVTSIGSGAFTYNYGIRSIKLPKSLKTIGSSVFAYCFGLTKVVFPAGLESIGWGLFMHSEHDYMSDPVYITFLGGPPAGLENGTFSTAYVRITYRPGTAWEGYIGHYNSVLSWTALSGGCGDGTSWMLGLDGTLRLSGNGTVSTADWAEYNDLITTIEIGSGIREITGGVFSGMTGVNRVIFDGGVPTMAANCFTGITAAAYYAEKNAGAWAEAQQGYGGALTWSPYCRMAGWTLITEHSMATLAAKEVTCTEAGLTEGYGCEQCGYAQTPQEEIPAPGHDYGEPEKVFAEDGSACTATFACGRCGHTASIGMETEMTEEVLPEGCVTPGHRTYTATLTVSGPVTIGETEEILPEGTYTQTMTEELPAKGHKEVTTPGVAATCTEPGIKDYIFCDECGEVIQEADEIPATGHKDSVAVEAQEPTCTEEGHTAKHVCEVCGEVLSESETIAATGHQYGEPEFVWNEEETECEAVFTCEKEDDTQTVVADISDEYTLEPNCTEEGRVVHVATVVFGDMEYSGRTAEKTAPAKGHTPVTDEAVAPTDRETGLTEGSHCGVCGETLEEQKEIPALWSYSEDGKTVTAYNCTEKDVTIPAGVNALGAALFKNNTEIESVRVPDEVTSVGNTTFYGTTGMKDIYLPDNLTGITQATFYNTGARLHTGAGGSTARLLAWCGKAITDGEWTLKFKQITNATAIPGEVYLLGWEGTEEAVVIPESFGGVALKEIRANAFDEMSQVKQITVPESVTEIAEDAFDGCSEELTVVSAYDAYARTWALANEVKWEHDQHIPEAVEGVPATYTKPGLTAGSVCAECGEVLEEQEEIPALDTSTLKTLKLPTGLTEIEEEAFEKGAFEAVIIPDGCMHIGHKAFMDCAQLVYVSYPAGAEFEEDAFVGCGEIEFAER